MHVGDPFALDRLQHRSCFKAGVNDRRASCRERGEHVVPKPADVEEGHGRERYVFGRQVQDIVNRGTAVQQHTTMGKLRSLGAPCSAAGVNNAGGALGIEIFIQ